MEAAIRLRPARTSGGFGVGLGLGLTLAAVLLGGLAVVAPARALTLFVGVAFLVIAFRNLAAGLALFTVLTFFLRIPGAPAAAGIKVAGGVLVLSWLFVLLAKRGQVSILVRDHPWLAYGGVFFIVWALCTSLWAAAPAHAVFGAFRLSQGVVLVFVVYTAIRNERELRWVMWAFVAGALLTAVIGLAGGSSPESFDPYGDTSRLAGQIGDPNEFASVLVPALVFSAFMLATVRSALLRWLLLVSTAIFAVALFLTNSRGGLVALGVTFLAVPFLAGPMRARAIAVILTVAALGVSYYVLVAPPQALHRISHFSAGGGTGRTDLWSIAVDMTAHHPFGGVGADNFQVVEPRYALRNVNLPSIAYVIDTPKVAHNTYLHVLAELGIVGFSAFALLIGGALLAAWRAVRAFACAGARDLDALSRGILIGTIGMLAAIVFISSQYGKQLWLLVGILAALLAIARRREAPLEPAAAVGGKPPAREHDRRVQEPERQGRARRPAALSAELATAPPAVPPGPAAPSQPAAEPAPALRHPPGKRFLVPAPPPALSGVGAASENGEWALAELERLVGRYSSDYPARVEEWRYHLVYLRDFVTAEGRLPKEFEGLVLEVFGTLIELARSGS